MKAAWLTSVANTRKSNWTAASVRETGCQWTATGVQCEDCVATFSKRANLARHTKTVHNNVNKLGCENNWSRFGLKADLQRHMRNISEKWASCCRIWGRSYAEQENLDVHNRLGHERTYDRSNALTVEWDLADARQEGGIDKQCTSTRYSSLACARRTICKDLTWSNTEEKSMGLTI